MKLVVKLIVGLVALVVLLLVCAVIFVGMSIDSLARKGIERGGTYALGTKTTLQSADVGLFSGTFAMKGLAVANPPGYASTNFLTLGSGGVQVTPSSLQKDVIELPYLRLDTVAANLEKSGDKTNYKVILDHLQQVTGGGKKEPAPPTGKEKKLVIKDLSIKNVVVKVDVLGGGSGPGAVLQKLTSVTVPIDEIKLQNVGQTGTGVGGTGVTTGELMGIIVRAVLAAAAEKGGGLIPADILGDLKGSLAALGDMEQFGMKTLGDAKGAVENIGKEAEKAVGEIQKVGEGLKDLIPKKK